MLTVSVLWFSARALKKNIFFDVDIVVKKKSKCGFSWSVLLPTTMQCFSSEREMKKALRDTLTRD